MSEWQYMGKGGGNPFDRLESGQRVFSDRANYIEKRPVYDPYREQGGTMPSQQLVSGNTTDDWYNSTKADQALIDTSLDFMPFGKLAPGIRSVNSVSGQMAPVIRDIAAQSPQGVRRLVDNADIIKESLNGSKRTYKKLREYAKAGTGRTRSQDFMMATRSPAKHIEQIWDGKEVTRTSPALVYPKYVNPAEKKVQGRITTNASTLDSPVIALSRNAEDGRQLSYATMKSNKAHEYKHADDFKKDILDDTIVPRDDLKYPTETNFAPHDSYEDAAKYADYIGSIKEIRARDRGAQSAKNIWLQSDQKSAGALDAFGAMKENVELNMPYRNNINIFGENHMNNTLKANDIMNARKIKLQENVKKLYPHLYK